MNSPAEYEARRQQLKDQQSKADKRARFVSGWLFVPIGAPLWIAAVAIVFPAFGLLDFAAVMFLGFIWLAVCTGIYWAMTQASDRRMDEFERQQESTRGLN